jgi:hypothetical protein
LQKELAFEKHQSRIASSDSYPSDQSLTADVAASVAELALVKVRLAMDLKFAPSSSGPCDEYAYCVAENGALKAQLEEIVEQKAIKDVAAMQSEIQLDAVQEQIEQLKSLEAQFDQLSAACNELEIRRASVTAESSRIMASHFTNVELPDEQLAYALVENRLLKEQYVSSQ